MSLKHAILVLLENHPGSGYDLVQRFRSGIGHFWNATHQQVYQELKELHAEGWVEFEVELADAGPEKKVYRTTRAGQRALKAWFGKAVKPPRVRDALLVKVFGAHLGDRTALLAELDQHRALHRRELDAYLALEQAWFLQDEATRRRYRNPYLTLRRGIRYQRDTLEWLDETRQWLENDALPSAPVAKRMR